MPQRKRTRRQNPVILPSTLPECVNKECNICMLKIRTGQSAIKIQRDRKCYHSLCIAQFYTHAVQNARETGAEIKTPLRNPFSDEEVEQIQSFKRAMRSRSRSSSVRASTSATISRSINEEDIIAELQYRFQLVDEIREWMQENFNAIEDENIRNAYLEYFEEEDKNKLRQGTYA